MKRVGWIFFAVSGLLIYCPGGTAGEATATAVDPKLDSRLSSRVQLQSRGIPVSRVLSALQQETGVSLSASGRAGDERLVAFERGAPLASVMDHLADLYRLRWTRETRSGKFRYRLEKPPAWEREEQGLRSRALREVFARMAQILRTPAGEPTIRGRREQWTPLFPEVVPALTVREADLVRDGFLYLPAARFIEPTRSRLVEKLSPILKKADEERTAALLSIREDEIARGIPPEHATSDKPPSRPEACTVTAELYVDRFPRATVGLRTDGDTWYSWVYAGGDDLADEGTTLYADRKPRMPDAGGSGSPASQAPSADRFSQRVILPNQPPAAEKDWIGALERLSVSTGLSIYTDCYHYFNHGLPGPPRGGFSLPRDTTAARALDHLCHPVANSGTQQLSVSSFWWRRGDTALVRSRGWLWEGATVLPADLIDRVAASVIHSRTISPADLTALAALNGLQVQSLGAMAGNQDFWYRGIRVPARLTLLARQSLLGAGVTWAQLTPADRQQAARLLGMEGEELKPDARARISAELRSDPAQGAPVLALIVWPFGQRGGRPVNLPLAGYRASPDLQPAGPEVRIQSQR